VVSRSYSAQTNRCDPVPYGRGAGPEDSPPKSDAPSDLIEVIGKQIPELRALGGNTHISGVAGTPPSTIPAGLSTSACQESCR
jgi:hypothetical protein